MSNDARPRVRRRCPRTWPHEAHGPWRDGEAYHPTEHGSHIFDCPGVPIEVARP